MPSSDADAVTYLYARLSLDRHDGAGIERQLEDGRGLCARRAWPIAGEFVDQSRSAWQPFGKRPDYERLLAAVTAAPRCRIVPYKIDRLYRRPRELEELIELGDRGHRILIADASGMEFDLGASGGRMFARQMVNWAASESDIKSERIAREKKQARERGLPHGGQRPFGWARRTITLPDGSEKLTWDPWHHDPEEAELIRKAVEDMLAGASLGDIRRRWIAAGVPQPQSGRAGWTVDGVRQVLGNPRNAGLVGHREEIKDAGRHYRLYGRPVVVGEARWPAIVDRAQWELLQALLERRGAFGKVPKRRSLLTGLLICSICGATMVRTADHAQPRPERYRKVWRCPTYKTLDRATPPCGNNWIDAEGVERLLTARALELAETVDLAAIAQERDGGGREAAELTTQLADLDRRADEAAVSYAAGRLDLRVLERATAELDRERRTLRERLGELAGGALLAPYLAAPGSLAEAWEERLTIDQKREVIRALVGQVRILPARRGLPRFDPDRVVPVKDRTARA